MTTAAIAAIPKRLAPSAGKLGVALAVSFSFAFGLSTAWSQSLRVVSYNIDADTGGAPGQSGGVTSGPGLTTVLQAIGNAKLAGRAQPIDVLALQELNYSMTTTTLQFIVDQLNDIYGEGVYNYDTTFDPTTGDFTGNGPNGLVYNTRTVQVRGAAPIGSASGSGAPRRLRYDLAPFGYNDHSADFALYVSHAKASSGASNETRRNFEANELRTDAVSLGPNAHVIYSGDYNISSSSEAAYQTMISPTVAGGVGQGIDSVSPTNIWNQSSTYRGLMTESADSLTARFDFQFVTSPMINQNGMRLVPGTYTPFGNNGSTSFRASVTSGSNTALSDLGTSPYSAAYRSSVLTALTTATDHLPVVADYSFATAVGIPGDYDHSGFVDLVDYNVWRTAFGSVSNLAADGNHNSVVDAADYNVWRDHFGSAVGSGAAANFAVPEPSATAILLVGCLIGLTTCRLKG